MVVGGGASEMRAPMPPWDMSAHKKKHSFDVINFKRLKRIREITKHLWTTTETTFHKTLFFRSFITKKL